ncbi:hypothetical protein ACJIZ3_001843 [Penstemon smallii]|uniref:Receptor-like serine/threonine-protein kinase n=1 Tax=Penstemon smallii TaxID=265156 RepID=A0ABD3U639_9LAMI
MQSVSIVSVVILLICLCSSLASSLDTLRQGDTLNFTSQLVSAGNIFTLGFHTPSNTNTSYIAIWYTNIDRSVYPDPVWIGNRNAPIPNNSSATFTINNNGSLLIMIPNRSGVGQNPFFELLFYYHWEELSTNTYNVSATLFDSGNFVLSNHEEEEDVILWQSFDYPTDTLLPGMKLGVNHRTGRNWIISSWFGVNNPASGAFTLEWDTSGDRLLVRRRGVLYWTSGEMRDYHIQTGEGSAIVKALDNIPKTDIFNSNYNFTNVTTDTEEYFTYSLIRDPNSDYRGFISGWRLNYLGDIVDDGGRPVIVQVSLCYGYNRSWGCELREQPRCRNQGQTFDRRSGYFRPVNGRTAPSVIDDNSSLSISDCRTICWNDCECAAFNGGEPGCLYWRGENLEFEQSLDGSSPQLYLLVPAPSNIVPASSNKRSQRLIWIILTVVIMVLLLSLCTAFFLVRRSRKRKREEEMNELLTLEGYTEETYELGNEGAKGHDLRQFTYASILAATSNFSSGNKLGEGGFGPVYKGKTPEGNEIAVKVLSKSSGQGLLEFKTELILISKLQHVNLVKLGGFCIHEDDKMIIYEYMPNKSLDFYLFDPSKRDQLDWGRRLNIIEGIAQGLLYLHKYSRLSIVHRDLKSGNILLDSNLNPKISDFGLARIFKQNTDEANTNRRVGTYGYMAPEYAMQGIFSYKSDVYSFGVLVLEIASGRKNSSFRHIEGPLNLVEYAWELWSKDSALELMDPTLRSSCIISQFQKCINIGLLCVENRAADRPTIEDIISMLKNETSSLPVPKHPAFITRNVVLEQLAKTTPENLSANEVTVSEIGGR